MKKNSQEQLLEFSKRLRTAMSEMHMNATDLANATGIGKSDISNYWNGKYMPKQDRIYKMASVLKVSPAWLFAIDVTLDEPFNALEGTEPVSAPIQLSLPEPNENASIVSTDPWDVDAAFTEQDADDIRILARGMMKASPEKRKIIIDMAKVLFAQDFDEEGNKRKK